MIIINDIHLGTQRQAGTTPATQVALKQYLQDEFRMLVERAAGQLLVINGDLFDGFSVDPGEVIKAYDVLAAHVSFGGQLALGAGNHDETAKGDKTSSFHLLAHIMAQFGEGVQVIDHKSGFTEVATGVWAIPHMLNQDLFDIEIDTSQRMHTGKVFFHPPQADKFGIRHGLGPQRGVDLLNPPIARGNGQALIQTDAIVQLRRKLGQRRGIAVKGQKKCAGCGHWQLYAAEHQTFDLRQIGLTQSPAALLQLSAPKMQKGTRRKGPAAHDQPRPRAKLSQRAAPTDHCASSRLVAASGLA